MKKILFLSILSFHAHAVSVGDITSIIDSNEVILVKEIENTTPVARYIGLKIEKITSPTAEGKVIPLNSNEILSTPSGLVLPGNGKDIFRIIYNGPQDNQERYYRLSWLDAPISSARDSTADKAALATTSAIINTILVVSPRQDKFDYIYEGGTVKNLGNVSFRIVAAGECLDPSKDIENKGCRERYYVMPGKSVSLKYTDWKSSKTHLGIWYNGKYINANK
jgi:Mat/Ecp fimbriae periplasmic chaperone